MGLHRVGHGWSDFACTHALEKDTAAHSSILAWRVPGTEEPGGLPSVRSHRVGHDWSNLAAAVEAYMLELCACIWIFQIWFLTKLWFRTWFQFKWNDYDIVIDTCFSLRNSSSSTSTRPWLFLLIPKTSTWNSILHSSAFVMTPKYQSDTLLLFAFMK